MHALADAGANPRVTDNWANKPSDLAGRVGKTSSREYLLQCEAGMSAVAGALRRHPFHTRACCRAHCRFNTLHCTRTPSSSASHPCDPGSDDQAEAGPQEGRGGGHGQRLTLASRGRMRGRHDARARARLLGQNKLITCVLYLSATV